MLFSSALFLYLFLPIVLSVYYLINPNYRNYWLLFASLIFFAWGGVSNTIILVVSIIVNYYIGLIIDKNINNKAAKRWLITGITFNILLLAIFKYTNFVIQNINFLFKSPEIPLTKIILPIGISFYTFHSLSYLVDIYHRKTSSQKNIFDLSLYICMFSQLIAGPIIRYSDVFSQLRGRRHTVELFSQGIERFVIGLARKVLIANTFAKVADEIFVRDIGTMNAATAWLGIICYTLQIYYDFAGYSDMAIGLGKMFGFNFKENFDFPYIAKSVKEFWRRWHMSLSSFFRDYVYISLGGNRISIKRTYINLVIVFFLTGFWHGASWSFVVWGLFHGFFMVIEKIGFEKILQKTWLWVQNFYTLIVVMFAWVLFRSNSLEYALGYWKSMFRFTSIQSEAFSYLNYINLELIICFIIAIFGAFGVFPFVMKIFKNSLEKKRFLTYIYNPLEIVFLVCLIMLCTMYLISGTYNPFIYFRF